MQLGHPFPGRNDRLAGRGMIFGFAVLHPERNITVAAYGGVARPFITREYDKSSILMIFFSESVQVFPECIVDLKIIGLMAGHIQKGFVPGKIKVLS